MQNKKVDISFCLPVYNVAPFITDCIKSIEKQDFGEYTYEIICVDDCSTDNTVSVIKELQKQNSNIFLFESKENGGVSASRNRAIKEAKGDYIWFVDPDDMIVPNSLFKLLDYAKKNDANVLHFKYKRIEESFSVKEISYETEGDFSLVGSEHFTGGEYVCSSCLFLFKREFLISSNLFFHEKLRVQEDTVFIYELTILLDSIYVCDGICYLYRKRSGSLVNPNKSNETHMRAYNSFLEMYNVYMEHYTKKDYKDKQILEKKIVQTKEKLAQMLAIITDKQFFKEQKKYLKKNKLYPYKHRWELLTEKGLSFPRRLIIFLLPNECFLNLFNFINRKKSKQK